MRKLHRIGIAAGFVGFCSNALGEVTVPDTGSYVVDQAGIVDDRIELQLNGWLRELEEKTEAQLKVLTVSTTAGEDFFTFVHRHAERWQLGKRGKDNGALVAIATSEREVRIHVGYGLEGPLPDSWCGSLSRNVFVPAFRAGRFGDGIFQGVVAVANKIADDANVKLSGIPEIRHQARRRPSPAVYGGGIVPLFVLVLIIMAAVRRRRYRRHWGGGIGQAVFWGGMLHDVLSGSRRSGGFGGSFGGGFGGFGGSFGGGGRFGGGGGGAKW